MNIPAMFVYVRPKAGSWLDRKAASLTRIGFAMILAVNQCALAAEKLPDTMDDLSVEYKVNPVGIDVLQPRLTWRLQSEQRGAVQTAYQIQVAETLDGLRTGGALTWDSGRVESSDSVQVIY